MLPLEWMTRAQKLKWSESDIRGLLSIIRSDTVKEVSISAVTLITDEKFHIGGVDAHGVERIFTTHTAREWKWYRSAVPESIITDSPATEPVTPREPIITMELCDCKFTNRSKRHDAACEIRARELEPAVAVVAQPEIPPAVVKPAKSAKLDKARVLPGQVKLF